MDAVVRDATMLGVGRCALRLGACRDPRACARGPRARSLDPDRDRVCQTVCARGRAAIEPVAEFSALLARSEFDRVICCVEPSRAGGQSGERLTRPSRALLLVGPEGGWSEDELAQCRDAGTFLLDLGPRTLRAEVAPTVALSALWSYWGWR